MKTQSVLPWFGSENAVAKDIGELLDGCKHVTIPFCGGLGVLPFLKARAIVANDLHREAIRFYNVLKHPTAGPALRAACQRTLSHPGCLEAANALEHQDDITRAWSYWVRCWLGRKGAGGTADAGKAASMRWNANGGGNATRIHAAAKDLDEWAELFHRAEFVCMDFRDVLAKVNDDSQCGIYADPPWVQTGERYEHSFTTDDHRELANGLCRFKHSTIVLRYGDDPFIRELYPDHYWTITEAGSRNQANNAVSEIWITRND